MKKLSMKMFPWTRPVRRVPIIPDTLVLGTVSCRSCNHEWDALVEAKAVNHLECPGKMQGCPKSIVTRK